MSDSAFEGEVEKLVRLSDEMVRIQAIVLRQSFESKSDFILALSQAGFENARIASLLGDSTASVRSAVNRAKKKNRDN